MKAADELISKMGKTRQTLSEKDTKEEGEELERQRGMTMVCDETSCVIVPLAAASNVAHGPKGKRFGLVPLIHALILSSWRLITASSNFYKLCGFM